VVVKVKLMLLVQVVRVAVALAKLLVELAQQVKAITVVQT
jgi:hypothetical protein